MTRIATVELEDILLKIPAIQKIPSKTDSVVRSDDLFICSLGFEPRTLAIPRLLSQSDYKANTSIVFKYGTNVIDNEVNETPLTVCLSSFSDRVISYNVDEPDFLHRIRRLVESISGHPTITVDISVFANRLLMRMIHILLDSDVEFRILYGEAETYHPKKEDYFGDKAKWTAEDSLGLERGVSEVIPSPEFPGWHDSKRSNVAILFPGFRAERSLAILNFIEPSMLEYRKDNVYWMVGAPHLSENAWRADAMREINQIAEDWPQWEVSTFEYKDTLLQLEKIYRITWKIGNITISPLGSKLQCLATGLFCWLHPDVRVIYAIPKEYNASQFSEGCRDVWEIDFGASVEIRAILENVGSIRIEA